MIFLWRQVLCLLTNTRDVIFGSFVSNRVPTLKPQINLFDHTFHVCFLFDHQTIKQHIRLSMPNIADNLKWYHAAYRFFLLPIHCSNKCPFKQIWEHEKLDSRRNARFMFFVDICINFGNWISVKNWCHRLTSLRLIIILSSFTN